MATAPMVPHQEVHRITYLPGHYIYSGIMARSWFSPLATTSCTECRGGAKRRSSEEPPLRQAPSPPPDSPGSNSMSPGCHDDDQHRDQDEDSGDVMPPPPVPDHRPPLPRRKQPKHEAQTTLTHQQEAPAEDGATSSSSTSHPIVTVDELGVVLPASGPERFEQSLRDDEDSHSMVPDAKPEDLDGQPLSAGTVYMLGDGVFKMYDPNLFPVPFCLTCRKWAFIDDRASRAHKSRYAWLHDLPLRERNEHLDDMVKRADEPTSTLPPSIVEARFASLIIQKP